MTTALYVLLAVLAFAGLVVAACALVALIDPPEPTGELPRDPDDCGRCCCGFCQNAPTCFKCGRPLEMLGPQPSAPMVPPASEYVDEFLRLHPPDGSEPDLERDRRLAGE